MHSFNFNKYYKNVKKIVIKAGIVAKKKLNKVKITHYKEKDDLVTETDLLVEDIIFRYISKTFPEHGFNSEEKGKYQTNADYIWVLDPIDGTKYYAKGLPLYSISLALEYKGNLIQGIVYIPEMKQLFCANCYAKKGSVLNKKRIQCSKEIELKNIDVCLEIPSKNAPADKLQSVVEKLKVLITHTRRVRIIGVGSIGLCYCALGGFDLYLNLGSNFGCHDYAAGKVIVEQADGEFKFLENSLIAGNSIIVKKVIDLLGLI